MKTKQAHLKAVFTVQADNAVNHGHNLEQVARYLVVDKKTEKTVVDARCWMGRSRSASTVKASIWISLSDKKRPDGWEWAETSGSGSAGGYGYHKISAAIGDAMDSAGVELYGTPYAGARDAVDMKTRAYINGVGESAIRSAVLAIAYAAGYTDCILVC